MESPSISGVSSTRAMRGRGRVEVDTGVQGVLVRDVALFVVLRLDVVELAALRGPLEEEVGGAGGRAVGPLRGVGERVLDLQRVVGDLLVGAERLVLDQVEVLVVVVEARVQQVQDDAVRRGVTRGAVAVGRVERLVPGDVDRRLGVDARVVGRVVAAAAAGAGRESEHARRGDRCERGLACDPQFSSREGWWALWCCAGVPPSTRSRDPPGCGDTVVKRIVDKTDSSQSATRLLRD